MMVRMGRIVRFLVRFKKAWKPHGHWIGTHGTLKSLHIPYMYAR